MVGELPREYDEPVWGRGELEQPGDRLGAVVGGRGICVCEGVVCFNAERRWSVLVVADCSDMVTVRR